MPPKPAQRSQKRKNQYLTFMDQLKEKNTLKEKDTRFLKDLSDLTQTLFPYLEPEKEQKISRKTLSELFEQYVRLQNNIEDLSPQVKESDEYHHFRNVMSKDIKMFHEALEDPSKDEFDLKDIFENSRSETIELDPKDLESAGANMSSRIHIKQPVDGYFTTHEPPYDSKKELNKLMRDFTGIPYDAYPNEDEKLKLSLIYYMTNPYNNKSPFFSDLNKQTMNDLHEDAASVASGFVSLKDFTRYFSGSLDDTCEKFLKGPGKNFNPVKTKLLINSYKNKESIAKLIDTCQKGLRIKNKNGILESAGINKNSKIDKRNSAMSMVAHLIGVDDVIASSTNMRIKINGQEQKGSFMKKAQGIDRKSLAPGSDFLKATPDSLEGSLSLKKDCANLQILDYICGNVDRHTGNFLYKFETVKTDDGKEIVKLVGLQGIDNDASFGANHSGKNEDMMQAKPLRLLKVIPKSTAEKIMKVQPETLRALLAGFDLSTVEIDKAVQRLLDVKEAIQLGKKQHAQVPRGELINETIKVVDDDELSKLSLHKQLKGEQFVSHNKRKKHPNMFSTLTSVFSCTQKYDTSYAILKKNNFELACQYSYKAMNKEDDVIAALDKIKENSLYFRGSDEYDKMQKKTNSLVKLLDNDKKILTNPLENNQIFSDIREKTLEAINATNEYISVKTEDIRKKKEKGERIKDNDLARLEAAKFALEKLEAFGEEYAHLNALIMQNRELSEQEAEKIKGIDSYNQAIEDDYRKMKQQLTPKLEDLATMEHDLKEDMDYNRSNAMRLHSGLAPEPPYQTAADVLLEAIDLDSRECMIHIAKELSARPENNADHKESIRIAAEKINANKLMKHILSNDAVLLNKVNTNVDLYKDLRDKFMADMQKIPAWKQETEKNIDTIRQSVEADKKLNDNTLTNEEKNALSDKVTTLNTLMQNGIGSESEQLQWVAEFLQSDFINPNGNQPEKASKIIDQTEQKLVQELQGMQL